MEEKPREEGRKKRNLEGPVEEQALALHLIPS